MRVTFYLLIFSAYWTMTHAQNPDSTGIYYVVDTIAAPNCYQSGDGAILLDDVSVPGTIDRYEWSDGSTMEDLIFVNGGTYQLTVYNTDGEAFTTEEFIVPEPDSLHISTFISPPTADSLSNGFIDLSMRGGTAPYELTMRFNQDTIVVMTDTFFRLADIDTGAYIFTVIDARGCTDSVSFTIATSRSCGLLVTAIIDPAECGNSPTGRIELLVEDAIEPYTIEWANRPGNRHIQQNLAAGSYRFKVTDRRNCVIEDSIEIINEDRIPPRAVVRSRILLYLDEEGRAEIFPQDILIGARDECHNNLTYQFEKNVFTCEDVGVSEVNFYVIDGVGNSAPYPIEIEIRDSAEVELIYQDTVYTALCNGIAQYESPKVRGSCASLSSGGVIKATTREIISPGTYEDRYYYVEGTGDTLWAHVTVIVADSRVRSFLIVTEPICNRGEDGSIAVALRNSATPVTYKWNNGSTDDYLFGIQNQKEYSVQVTEGNGCVFELTAFIEGPDSLSVELQQLIEKEGTIDIVPEVTGGNLPLEYRWFQNGREVSSSKNLLNVEDGARYMLQVTDAKGCVSNPLIVDRIMTASSAELENEIHIFPNPLTGDLIHIRFDHNFADYEGIRILNSNQQVVKKLSNLNVEIEVSMYNLPAGIYVIQLFRKDGRVLNKKIIRL
mgnify:FL=1